MRFSVYLCEMCVRKYPSESYFHHRRIAFSLRSAHIAEHHSGPTTTGELSSLNGRVLILNQSYEPISICSAKKALTLIFLTKAELVEQISTRSIRTVRTQYPFPSVIRLCAYLRVPFRKIELSRKNIMRRDGMRCTYCGTGQPPLTMDHIIPRSRGGTDSWENLTTACIKCNNKKGNRTPDEAGMRLMTVPKRPHHVLFLKHSMGTIDETWRPYLFMD
jgi:5-methylcytosine-specific restriction endonuclease McrA